MKNIIVVLFILISVVTVYADDTVKVGIYNNGSLSFKNDEGEFQGFVIDILNETAEREGWDIEYVYGKWVDVYNMLQNGKVDMLGPIAYSKERAKIFNYTDQTLLSNWGRIYAGNSQQFNSIMDLDSKRIAVLQNDIYYIGSNGLRSLLQGFGIQADIVEVESYIEVFEAVKNGYADAGLVSRLFGMENESRFGVERTVIFFNPIEIRFAINKQAPEFIKKELDRNIADLKNTQGSVYHLSLSKWFAEAEAGELTPYLKTVIIYAAAITFLALILYMLMRFRIRAKTKELLSLNMKLKEEAAERRAAERDLKTSKERLQYAVEAAKDGLWDYDVESGRVYLSKNYIENMNYNKDTVYTYEDYKKLIHPDDLAKFQEELDKHMSGETPYFSVEYRLKDGKDEYKWMQDRGKVVEWSIDGKPLRVCGVNRNISELKDMENQLRKAAEELEYRSNALKNLNDNLKNMVDDEAEKRKVHEELLAQKAKISSMGEIVGAIAHQWRQPLSTIGLLIQDIKDAYDYGELNEEYIDDTIKKALAQIDNMSKTIDNFRSFFKPAAEKKRFDVRETVVSTIRILESQFKVKDIVFSLRYISGSDETRYIQLSDIVFDNDHAIFVLGYPNEFSQILLDIFKNSRDAIIEKRKVDYDSFTGKINVEMIKEENKGIIKITDNGTGVPGELQKNIFDPYFTTKDQPDNKGTGLYMAAVVIENKMGGNIKFENTEDGAVISLELPLSKHPLTNEDGGRVNFEE